MRFGMLLAAIAALFTSVPASATSWYFDVSAIATSQTRITDINFGSQAFERNYIDNFLFTGSGIANAFGGSGTVSEVFAKSSCGLPFHEDQRSGYQYCSFSGTLTFVGNQIFGSDLKVYASGSGCGGFCGVDLVGAAPTFSVTFRGSDGGPGTSPVPEPSAWLLLIVGFGIAGLAIRLQNNARYQASRRVSACRTIG